jgi:hypothetical protein
MLGFKKVGDSVFNEEDGVWRTIGGRRVFIRTGQKLSDAMKESGKFNTQKQKYDDSNFKYLPEDDDEAYDKYYEMSDEC